MTKIKLIEIVGKAVRGEAGYRDVWDKAKRIVEDVLRDEGNVEGLQILNEYFEHYLENAFAESEISSVVNTGIKELAIRLREVVKMHYKVGEERGRTLRDKLLVEAGLTESTPAVERFIAAVEGEWQKKLEEKKRQILDEIFKKLPAKVRKELWQKIVEMSNLGALGFDDYKGLFEEKLGLNKVLTDEQRQEIIKLANAVQEVPEGSLQQQRAVKEMMDYIAKAEGVKKKDVMWGMYYASILSGPSTHLKNTVENTLLMLDGLTNAPPREWYGRLKAIIQGINKSLPEAMGALQGDIIRHLARGKYEETGALDLMNFRGGRLNPANWAKYVGRLLKAADVVAYYPSQEMTMYSLAVRKVRLMGLKGREASEELQRLLNDSADKLQKAREQAEAEGLSDTDKVRRINQILEAGRDKDIMAEAEQFGKFNTFNNTPYGLAGAMARAVQTVFRTKAGEGLRFIVPFTNIVANVFNMQLNYTPVGILRGIYGKKIGFESWDRKLTDNEASDMIARGLKGTLLMMILAALTMIKDESGEPVLNITASGPADGKKRSQLMSTGWRPYSIKLGGRYVPYDYISPVMIPMLTIGLWQDMIRYRKDNETLAWYDVISTLGLLGMAQIMDKSFMSGVADLFRAMDPNRESTQEKYISDLALKTVTGFVPNALKQFKYLWDPQVYETHNFLERVMKNIGIAQSEIGMKPKINLLGEPVIQDWNRVFVYTGSGEKNDQVWNFIVKNGAWISTPDKNTLIWDKTEKKDRQMTEEEYYNFVKISGQEIRRNIEKSMNELNMLTAEDKRVIVRDIVNKARENAMYKLSGREGKIKQWEMPEDATGEGKIKTEIRKNIREEKPEKNDVVKKQIEDKLNKGQFAADELKQVKELVRNWDKAVKQQKDLYEIDKIIEDAGITQTDGKPYLYRLTDKEKAKYEINWKRVGQRFSKDFQYRSETSGKLTDSMTGTLARRMQKGEITQREGIEERAKILKARERLLEYYKAIKN